MEPNGYSPLDESDIFDFVDSEMSMAKRHQNPNQPNIPQNPNLPPVPTSPLTPQTPPEPPTEPKKKERFFDDSGVEYFIRPDGSKIDKNGLTEDLWGWRNEMLDWVEQYQGDLGAFIRCRGGAIRIEGGTWFDFNMVTNVLRLSVPEYKKLREKKGEHLSIDQFLFAAFHEFGHKRAKIELKRDEVENWMQQLNYEASKSYETLDQNGKRIRIRLDGAYHRYYNIMEDPIVNAMVLNTHHYSQSLAPDRYRQIVELYRSKFFQLYEEVGEGEGDYTADVDEDQLQAILMTGQQPKEIPMKYRHVGEGNGNLRLLKESDYKKGFDWNKIVPKMGDNRSGQFVTFFMKNQMAELSAHDVYDETANPAGKHILHPDVRMIYTRPLLEVYKTLLNRFVEKYKDDPERMSMYLQFMTEGIPVTRYREEKGEIVTDTPPTMVYRNVMHPNCLDLRQDGTLLNPKIPIKTALATTPFEQKIKRSLLTLGLSANTETRVKFLDIYNAFRTLNFSGEKRYGMVPFRCTMLRRTELMRELLEPIYSLLCILDDTFETVVPPERPGDENGEGSDDSGDTPEVKIPPIWRVNDKVVCVKKGSPNYNRVGKVARVEYNESGDGVTWVDVEYLDEYIDNSKGEYKYEMSPGIRRQAELPGESEIFTDPQNDLALYAEEGDENQKGNIDEKDKRKKVIKKSEKKPKPQKPQKSKDKGKDKDKDKDQDQSDSGDESDEEDDDSGQNPDDLPNKDKDDDKSGEGKDEKERNKALEDENLDESIKAAKELAEQLKDEHERQSEARDILNERNTYDYQRRKRENSRVRDLVEALKQRRKEQGETDPQNPEFDQESIRKMMELETEVASPANELAKVWSEVIENITHEFDILYERARSGRLDMQAVQRYWEEIIHGMDIKNMLLYERLVEVLKTEIKPKMLRLVLLVDNSGSMEMGGTPSKMDRLKFAVLLMNESLRSLRVQFQDAMKAMLGSRYTEDLDIVCDIEIVSFGQASRVVKPFEVRDLTFLDNKAAQFPGINVDAERVASILAFQKLDAREGTHDAEAWLRIITEHEENPQIAYALNNGLMTEVVIQVSDGDIEDWADVDNEVVKKYQTKRESRGKKGNLPTAKELIAEFRRLYPKINVVGFSIGGDRECEQMKKRHNIVIQADTSEMIVKQFSQFLRDVVREGIEKPMVEAIHSLSEEKPQE